MLLEKVTFHGHPLIKATHKTTLEVTKEAHVSERGDCIIGVEADKACADFSVDFKRAVADERVVVKILIEVENHKLEIKGRGDREITLEDKNEIVARRSSYISPRTLAIQCDKAAANVPRSIVKLLRKPETIGCMTITVHKE